MRDRAWRRKQEHKKKKSVSKHNWFSWFDPTPKHIGIKSHSPKLCSCFLCGNPRKHSKQKTLQELIFFDILDHEE